MFQAAGQLQGHQLANRDGISGLPECDLVGEHKELGRATTARALIHLSDPRVDAARIGLQRGQGFGVLCGEGFHGQRIEVKPAQQIVDFQGPRAEQFGQASLSRAPHHGHLPQTVLCMGEPKAEIDVLIRGTGDMGDVGVVADDLDGGCDPRNLVPGLIFGQ